MIFSRFTYPLIFGVLLATGCTYTEKLKDGPTAFEHKQFAVAADFFKKDYNKTSNRREKGHIAFQIGECYERMNRNADAADWYKKSADEVYPGALLRQANALKGEEEYDEALSVFREAGREAGSVNEYQVEMQSCKSAKKWLAEVGKTGVSVENLSINSNAADYGAMPAPNGGILFASDRGAYEEKTRYGWTNRGYSDIYLAEKSDETPTNVGAPVNTPYNEGGASFNQQFTEMYFTRCGDADKDQVEYCRLYRSAYDGKSWSQPEPLPINPDKANVTQPCLTPDGKGLFFASDMADGYGGYDLYFAFKLNEGGWSEPKNLGGGINTTGNEMFPWLDADTLYFASDGWVGMGGLDIFKATKKEGRYSNATNLRAPYNSGGDDFSFFIDRLSAPEAGVLQKGYFCSSRADGKGNDDVYRFTKRPLPPPPVDTVPKPIIAYKIMLDGLTREAIHQDPENPNSPVESYTQLDGVKVIVTCEDTTFALTTPATGTFKIQLKEERDYHFLASKNGYFAGSATITTKDLAQDPKNPVTTLNVELTLDKIIKDREIVLENIYYDFDKWNIREDAKPTLNKLVNILKDNPAIKIELASHTDCRGNDAYNLSLSQRRAESAVEYIIARGISQDRITAKGYGETTPIAVCACSRCSEDQHQTNRRTSFKVVE